MKCGEDEIRRELQKCKTALSMVGSIIEARTTLLKKYLQSDE
jgi:hypothetical protein